VTAIDGTSTTMAVGGPGGDHTGEIGADTRPTTSGAPGSGGAGRDGNSSEDLVGAAAARGDAGRDGIVIIRYALPA
jgi:hypothetical protein